MVVGSHHRMVTLLAPLLVAFWLLPNPFVNSAPQAPCQFPGPLNSTTWMQGVAVTILFRQGDFSATEKAAMTTALSNWQAA
jgi:hypothetical protein